MSVWAIIPIKAPDACKSRLRGALSDDARRALVRTMLHRVVGAAEAAANVDKVMLLGPHRHGLPPSTPLLADHPGEGLNTALKAAAQNIDAGAQRLLIIAADLPNLTPTDVEALSGVENAIAIAPDRSGKGTNALSLPAAVAREFRFAFGVGSFEAHATEAARLSLPLCVIRSDTLALDIDEPGDLALVSELTSHHAPSACT